MNACLKSMPLKEPATSDTPGPGSAQVISRDEPEADWPNREFSQLITVGKIRWHVQLAGKGPVLLMLHGTGSATHSWRDLLPLLAQDHTVVAPDLPGHGYSLCSDEQSLTLPGMARAVTDLLDHLRLTPETVVGHSAGAAVLIRMTLDGDLAPRMIVGINAALLPFGGALTGMFQPMARLVAAAPLLPRIIAYRASQKGSVERLIAGTGSRLGERAIADYRRVFCQERHVAATLSMMANWNLQSLLSEFSISQTPLLLIVGDSDRTVPPSQARRVKAICPATRVEVLAGLGHLAHEQDAQQVAAVIRAAEGLA